MIVLALGALTSLDRLGRSRFRRGVSSSLSECASRFGGDRPRVSRATSDTPTGFREMPEVLPLGTGLGYAFSSMFLASGCGTLCARGGYSRLYVISGALGKGMGDLVLAFVMGGLIVDACSGGGGGDFSGSGSKSMRLGVDSDVNLKLSMDLLTDAGAGVVAELEISR